MESGNGAERLSKRIVYPIFFLQVNIGLDKTRKYVIFSLNLRHILLHTINDKQILHTFSKIVLRVCTRKTNIANIR